MNRYLAELIGTSWLVLGGCGSAVLYLIASGKAGFDAASGNEVNDAPGMVSPVSPARQSSRRTSIEPGDSVVAPFHPSCTHTLAGDQESRDVVMNGKVVVSCDKFAMATADDRPPRPAPRVPAGPISVEVCISGFASGNTL